MILLISYDLNKHEHPEAYSKVRSIIEHRAIDYKKALYSQWLVETTDGPDVWLRHLREAMDKDDFCFIVKVQAPYQGWLPEEIWEWLKTRI